MFILPPKVSRNFQPCLLWENSAGIPSLIKRLRRDVPLHLERDPIKRLRSCLLISPFNSLDISEAQLHFVRTAGVLTSNGTLGRTGLICRSFRQQQRSGPDFDSLKLLFVYSKTGKKQIKLENSYFKILDIIL